MKKTLIMAALIAPTILSLNITTYAKAKTTKVSVNQLTENSNYISGKATKKSTVKLSRKGYTYALGHATKKGTFKLKLKDSLSNGWKYTLKVSEKGYKSKTVTVTTKAHHKNTTSKVETVYVPTAGATTVIYQNDQAQITSLSNQIKNLQDSLQSQINSGNVDSSANSAAISKIKNQISGLEKNSVTTSSIDDLTKQLNDLQDSLSNKLTASDLKNINDSIATLNDRLAKIQSEIDYLQSKSTDIESTTSDSSTISQLQTDVKNLQDSIIDLKASKNANDDSQSSALTDITNHLTDLENQVNSGATITSGQINDIQNDIEALKTQQGTNTDSIVEIQNSVDDINSKISSLVVDNTNLKNMLANSAQKISQDTDNVNNAYGKLQTARSNSEAIQTELNTDLMNASWYIKYLEMLLNPTQYADEQTEIKEKYNDLVLSGFSLSKVFVDQSGYINAVADENNAQDDYYNALNILNADQSQLISNLASTTN